MSQLNAHLVDAQATDTLGQALAAVRPARAMVQLHGDLGAGKSTLARALLRALGVTGPIRSPTYTLVERYPLGTGDEAWHLDLYRIGQAGELDFLGLDEGSASLWLVEWPERGAGALPPVDLDVELAVEGEGRSVTLLGRSESGRDWLARLSDVPQLRPLYASSQEE
ncbi:tRNA (adenosine(37)-N6)-threonylcarbamoyltransferase complex ATPase subunit type 1 TsaE [Xanthomonas arboricola]|uniref:tRNA threonylcarbamoyladenosine biosynthesis protein TsaE n=1 Tax=Xanthomonas arboricola pv. guizotiae TaxID=487867 RepID=A0A2S7A3F2_9XANT|nr:tRNA (adenosine(37)-N6)-threonylcarbamoyltransferase complex ATPase subunit type 1 TsaE [Xanthomonas arboricola]PPU00623.1 tRNA (adenosine(37)-N6)-threonylcarbamoyltransferase complex ATPase subunit type 1 TsaE [Xanthomonas arboricola pv. guizotiae]PPU23984.1 tRNA (adenosine(37)-N6)-threonylcarbamoyltransferase complex ATPase subunit type 1 TsaE [Xanthomonas arboricola pv. guizotiae]